MPIHGVFSGRHLRADDVTFIAALRMSSRCCVTVGVRALGICCIASDQCNNSTPRWYSTIDEWRIWSPLTCHMPHVDHLRM